MNKKAEDIIKKIFELKDLYPGIVFKVILSKDIFKVLNTYEKNLDNLLDCPISIIPHNTNYFGITSKI